MMQRKIGSRSPIAWRKQSILDLYKLVFAVFLFLAPWLFAFQYQPARSDSWVTGLLLILAALAALVAYDDREELVMMVVAIWVLVSPWVLRYPHAAAMKVHIGVGLVVAYLAALELWLMRYEGRNQD
jgi:hypothetical protein